MWCHTTCTLSQHERRRVPLCAPLHTATPPQRQLGFLQWHRAGWRGCVNACATSVTPSLTHPSLGEATSLARWVSAPIPISTVPNPPLRYTQLDAADIELCGQREAESSIRGWHSMYRQPRLLHSLRLYPCIIRCTHDALRMPLMHSTPGYTCCGFTWLGDRAVLVSLGWLVQEHMLTMRAELKAAKKENKQLLTQQGIKSEVSTNAQFLICVLCFSWPCSHMHALPL